MIRSAAATLQYGGTEALRKLVVNAERHHVYAVDEQQRELLGREHGEATKAEDADADRLCCHGIRDSFRR